MSDPRKLPTVDLRVETSVVRFGDDWPGLFIRGKHCFAYKLALEWLLSQVDPEQYRGQVIECMHLARVRGLVQMLDETRTRPPESPRE